jgi:hypothetical protein
MKLIRSLHLLLALAIVGCGTSAPVPARAQAVNTLPFPKYTRSTLPAPYSYEDRQIIIHEPDGTRGIWFSDGTSWTQPSLGTTTLSNITDASANGRSLVAAANYAAMRTLLSLGNVDNTADTAKPVSTAQQTALDLKANIASPTFTGTPAGPTAAAATNTTQLATTAHVFAERTNTATLTNKTMTSPVLNTPTIATPTITAGTIDGEAIGFRHVPQVSQSAAYTTVLTDCGKAIYHPSADTTARIFTVAANASVAAPIGCTISIVNDVSAGALTIAITSDTLLYADTGGTGSRTCAAVCFVTLMKITTTKWIISGPGLT